MKRETFTNRIQSSKRIIIKVGSARLSGNTNEINDFLCHIHLKNISVSFSLHEYNPNHLLINYTKK
jgi:hypothetical protein